MVSNSKRNGSRVSSDTIGLQTVEVFRFGWEIPGRKTPRTRELAVAQTLAGV
ncbi:hypothetical protein ZHAS_00013231 [Anopheles sinensis]|uniref:Uncharacterized protein n=1 Tax=Anopheles sinensis TaxID=74873 RepID=A0A084W4Z4_ANOSI|nr:hypothetical protein ZHAS_00013231 [Anopheles sinensis]